ncbi:MAG: type 1 glutamine amidotransferase [Clostridium sp.]|nr:type 1 glutamine amidotransferase [Clostridium sp.]
MQKKIPLIGITPGFDYDENKIYINKGYCKALELSGAMPFVLPVTENEEIFAQMVEYLDGFLLSGCPDVDAAYWGEYNNRYGGAISPFRDRMEIFIARHAMARNKPVLGICRGMQVLNIAAGGTIYQDIYSQIKDRELLKHSQDAPKWYPVHKVKIKEGTKLYHAHGLSSLRVNSFHHQAVKDVADGFIVAAVSEDGIVECIEHKSDKFALGVQWHPELLWERNPQFLEIFKKFVSYAG